MSNLVTSNLKHHLGRTAASVIGVGLGVVLVILTVGLMRGMLRARGERDARIGVEIMVSQRGQGISISSSDMSLPVTTAVDLARVPGVAAATPVGQNLELKGENALGIRQVDGIEFDGYTAVSHLRILRGERLPEKGDVAIVDMVYATDHETKLGDKISALDREFTVIGVYEPESGARIKIPLATMQEALAADGKCSMVYVKCQNPAEQETVARRINEQFPDLRILFTKDLPELFATGFSAVNVFLNVVTGLSAIISLLVILLTMYTAVTERTRQIGILKSLGASKRFIIGSILKEALTISLLGVVGGIAVALVARFFLINLLDWTIDIELNYVIYAGLAGLLAGAIGAAYPALRAASQDPVDALSYE